MLCGYPDRDTKIGPEVIHSRIPGQAIMKKNNALSLFLFFLFTFAAGARNAEAGSYMAYIDASACRDSGYGGRMSGADGPFDSEEACQADINSVRSGQPQLDGCAVYSCRDEGSGDDSSADSSGVSMPSIPLPSGGGMSQQALGVGLGVLGAVMIGAAVGSLLSESPQQEAARKAQEAAQAAEQQRQAAEQAKKAEETKERLLGEIQGSDSGSTQLSLMGTSPESSLQLMTGGDALAPMTDSVNRTAPKTPTSGKTKVKHSDAFNKGYSHASQCISQNTITACYGQKGAAYQACLDDYRAGYEVGQKEMALKVNKAIALGRSDAEQGRKHNGFSDPDAVGGCRIELDEAYTSGYNQGGGAGRTAATGLNLLQ